MCGIVGLHLRDPELEPELGALLSGMLGQVAERGPDSAGVAVYGDLSLTPPGVAAVSILAGAADAREVLAAVGPALPDGTSLQGHRMGQTLVLLSSASPELLDATIRTAVPDAIVAGLGEEMAVLKGVGSPITVAEEFGLAKLSGWQGIGHTRMATESAVTPEGSHPFSVGPGQCLVHNGSFANHATIRRELEAEGVRFDSENDSEVGARFVAHELAQGADLEKSLRLLCDRFDGFYTLLVSTPDSFAVVRDAVACKPAIVAETPRWVAMASEYRALAGLPGIEDARLFEPEPEEVYVWSR